MDVGCHLRQNASFFRISGRLQAPPEKTYPLIFVTNTQRYHLLQYTIIYA